MTKEMHGTGITIRTRVAVLEFRAEVVADSAPAALELALAQYKTAAENRDLNMATGRYTVESIEEYTAETQTWTILFHN